MVLEEKVVNYREETLGWALPEAEFVERHSADVPAPLERTWDALHQLRWSDLRLTVPFLLVRGLRPSPRRLMDGVPVTILTERRPAYVAGAKIGQPWRLRPPLRDVASLDELREFAEPGWLKYGMDFTLEERRPGVTTVTTWTRCEPTDEVARRRFRPYWILIRPFSGLIRRELLAVLAKRAAQAP